MGPGAALIIGVPFIILALALLVIWRRERIQGPPKSSYWFWFYRAVTLALVVFMAYMVASLFVATISPPPR
jgi:amino acid transporter